MSGREIGMVHTKDTFRDGAGTRTGTLGRARSWRSLLDKNIIASPPWTSSRSRSCSIYLAYTLLLALTANLYKLTWLPAFKNHELQREKFRFVFALKFRRQHCTQSPKFQLMGANASTFRWETGCYAPETVPLP